MSSPPSLMSGIALVQHLVLRLHGEMHFLLNSVSNIKLPTLLRGNGFYLVQSL